MRQNRMLNLLARNARKGEFRAETSAEGVNTLYLYDAIVDTPEEAEWFGGVDAISFVHTLKGLTGDVHLRINSPGGSVFAARAMAQAMREHDGQVIAHVDGVAASAATFITSGADRTIMAPGAMLMVHKAWSLAFGNADDFLATASLLDKIDGTIAETYAAAATARGVEPADFAALMAAETWLTGAEAIELGLADTIDEAKDKKAAAQARARWDLSAYKHAPAAGAPPSLEPKIVQQRPDIAGFLLLNPPG
jgi:ATP-dependent Clp protease protease subunit